MKYLCVANRKMNILYASKHYPGRMHDKTIFEEESQEKTIPEHLKKLFDLAFFGIEKHHQNVIMPKKKPKGRELTNFQKEKNKKISRVRVKIENAFAGVKRLRVAVYTSRAKRDSFINLIFILSCGIWNFYLWAR